MTAVTNTRMCSLPREEHSGHSTKHALWLKNDKIPPWSPAWPHPRHFALDKVLNFSASQLPHLYSENHDSDLSELLEGFNGLVDDLLRAQCLDWSSRRSTNMISFKSHICMILGKSRNLSFVSSETSVKILVQ